MTAHPTPTILHVAAVEYTVEFLLLPQLRALRTAGYSVRVACTPGPEGFSAAVQTFDPVDVRFPRALQPAAMAAAAVQLARVVRRMSPDVMHLHSPAAAIVSRLLPRTALPRRTRIVYTVHGFPHRWESSARRDRLLARVEQAQARKTDALLFQSQEDLHEARTHGFRSRLIYLGNGVGDEWFASTPPPPSAPPLRLLFIGRLVREKGLLDLLDALERVPEAVLAIAGGELSSERDGIGDVVRERIAKPPLAGRVHLLGIVSPARLREEIVGAHAVVLPSYREGLPRSLIEGMASGRPALATAIRGCREVVEHDVGGLLFGPGDVGGLAQCIRRLADMAPPAYETMRVAARRRAWEHYREATVVERLINAYRDLGIVAREGT